MATVYHVGNMFNSGWRLLLTVLLLLVLLSPTSQATPPADLQRRADEIRRQGEAIRRQAAAHQREVQQRIDAARQRMNTSLPSYSSSNRARVRPPLPRPTPNPGGAHRRIEYTFNDGRPFAYVFVLRLTRENQRENIGGVGVFTPVDKIGGSWKLVARDNIQPVRSLQTPIAQPADQTMMLRRTMHVGDEGRKPDEDENLPAMLGNIEDWFFPPIPRYPTERRAEGHSVVKGLFDGEWTSVGLYNKDDHSTKAWYEWSIEPQGITGDELTVRDARVFRRDDGAVELVGKGQFTFDTRYGILRQRSFRGQFKVGNLKTDVAIDIMPANLAPPRR